MNRNSGIYEGTIRHRRVRPVSNEFRYRLFLMYLDLEELDRVFDCHPFWSAGRFNIASFRRQDHTGDPEVPLVTTIRNLVSARTGMEPGGPIRLLTHLRYFGYCFNPVSFYYCFDASGTRVDAIVSEIHNTPWGEEHLYVLGDSLNEHPAGAWRRYRFKKSFHVSPFMGMDLDYDWRFRMPGPSLAVHMILRHRQEPLFDASLLLKRCELNRGSLTRVLFAYPFMTYRVSAMIYWQALRLHLKGAPFYAHPDIPDASGEEVRK